MPSEMINGFLVTNDSGEFEALHGWEFGITEQAKGWKKPSFLTKMKRTDNDGMRLDDGDQHATGEFWIESRRGPKVIDDLDSLGLEIGREQLLDRRSGGY